MGEIERRRIVRGKRVVEVAPVEYNRDPSSVVSLTIRLGSGGNTATVLLTEPERRALITALGGLPLPDEATADRLANGAYDRG